MTPAFPTRLSIGGRKRASLPTDRNERFARTFDAHHQHVLAYAMRRVLELADAEDVTAETFTIAWRRILLAPEPEEARPWLFGIARRVIANHRRSIARRLRLALRFRSEIRQPRSSRPVPSAIEALMRLTMDDQELLRLLAWEQLTQAEVATVLGTSPNAIAIRLNRARHRFSVELARLRLEEGEHFAISSTPVKPDRSMPGDR